MLRQQDVGHRIVVRRNVANRNGRTLFTDALGELIELTETHLTLATARGPLRVPLAEVHRAKRVPPARRPTASAVIALERAADEAWPAPVRDRMGDWLLRAAGGWTGRANSALPIGDPDRPLDAAIDAVVHWYAGQGQPALINVPLPLAAPIGTALDERSWGARPLTLVQTAPLATLRAAPPGPATPPGPTAPPDPTTPPGPATPPDPATPRRLPPVELASAPSPEWLALAYARKIRPAGSTTPGPADAAGPTGTTPVGTIPAAVRHVLTAVARVRFAHVYAGNGSERHGELLAIGRGTVTGGGRWLGISLIEVVPGEQRRGLARHVIRALAEWAAGQGATDAFLQVEERNANAVALYRRLGFSTHHTYLTRVLPGHH